MAQDRARPVLVEVVRLAIVLLLLSVGYAAGPPVAELLSGTLEETDPVQVRFVTSAIGALVGYVLGGVGGRGFVSGVDRAEAGLRRIDAADLIAAILGGGLGGLLAVIIGWPLLIIPARLFTVPLAMSLVLLFIYLGGRLGAAKAGDLLRFLGARGRLEVTTSSGGRRTKLVDTSALIDGRILDVVRAGFIEGTLVVPRFVLDELQTVADAEDRRRRAAGRRGLDTLRAIQGEAIIAVEITDEDPPEVSDVDAKLAALARARRSSLVTVDSNLARVAEISGVRVLNLHELAESLRPPVLPGERVILTVAKHGREAEQGVGYLPDGTMVVIERGSPYVGEKIVAEVTSLLQTRNGRMVFADLVEPRQ